MFTKSLITPARAIIGTLSVVLLVLTSASAAAQPADAASQQGKARDVSFTVSLRGWQHTWERPITVTQSGQSTARDVATDEEIMPIPGVAMRYKRLLVSASYFTNTYDFSSFTEGGQEHRVVGATRKELDVNIGYFVYPQLALSVGWKNIKQQWDVATLAGGGSTRTPFSADLSTPTFGVLGALPLYRDFFAYGNAAFGKDSYRIGEIGLGVNVTEHTLLTLGYKSQRFSVESGTDATKGLIGGLAYTF
jgi:hypothetical protein